MLGAGLGFRVRSMVRFYFQVYGLNAATFNPQKILLYLTHKSEFNLYCIEAMKFMG